jgi:hypothetical protein
VWLATTLSTLLNFGPGHAWAWLTPAASVAMVAAGVAALLVPLPAARGRAWR